jgi:molybdenum cofactor cytidylyltransferase
MGAPKQALHFRGESLLRRAALAAQAAGSHPIVVVVGAHEEVSRRELRGVDVHVVANEQWESGMASSIRAGLAALLASEPHIAAAILLLCDQPHVSADVVSRLISAFRTTRCPVIASAYGGSFGAPALFGSALFRELSSVAGAAGAKQVIQRHSSVARFLPFACAEVDIDTPDDYARLLENEQAQQQT